jgi:outer membrane murein-binding lipoprotein Lpp
MHQFQDIVLIVVSIAAFMMALYCVLFMVPVKRFVERINSLGGGMKGIEEHVAGIRDDVQARLAELEQAARQQLAEARQAAAGGLDKLARENRELQRELEKLRKDLQALQAELRATGSDTMRAAQSCDGLSKQIEQLRNDFDALDVELRESVRQLVADSYNTVESTILSALDAVQEEILYGTSGLSGPARALPPRPEPSRPAGGSGSERRGRDNIIPVGPLFSGLADREVKPEQTPRDEEPGNQEPDETPEGDDEPA